MPSAPGAADEIKRLYFGTSKHTVAKDLERAIALLISLDSDEARERVAVYMDGLAQMRSEWGVKTGAPPAAATPTPTRASGRSKPAATFPVVARPPARSRPR